MYTNDYIRLCLTDTNPTQVIYGVEGDLGARWITADIVNDKGEAWEIPSNATPMIRYSKPDGTYGAYDTLENGSSAFTVDGSTIRFGLAGQSMTVAGDVQMELTFFGPSSRVVTTLPFTLRVYPSVAPTRLFASADYVNLLNSVMSQTAAYAAQAQASAETVAGYETKFAYRELDPVTWSDNQFGNMVLRNTYLDASTIWVAAQNMPLSAFVAVLAPYLSQFAYRELDPVTWGGAQFGNMVLNSAYLDASTVWSRENETPLSTFISSMRSFASKLSTDASWTLLSGTYASGKYAEYRKVNGMVELRVNYSTGAPSGTDKPLGTLPAGYRPDKTLYVPGYVRANSIGTVNIRTNGVVDLTAEADGDPFYATAVFAPV